MWLVCLSLGLGGALLPVAVALNDDTLSCGSLKTPISSTGPTPKENGGKPGTFQGTVILDEDFAADTDCITITRQTTTSAFLFVHSKSTLMEDCESTEDLVEALRKGKAGPLAVLLPQEYDPDYDKGRKPESVYVVYVGSDKTEGTMIGSTNEKRRTFEGTKCSYMHSVSGESDPLRSFSKTSVLFVSVSFIILMVISLAWLVFYYVQRFRYAHAKDRLARRLFNAAKKALTKIPTRALRAADKELETDCPVCIEPYHQGDIIRTLPCKHVFHKTCVDPWLLEHRTCPMCKSDILKAFGYNLGHSEDSVRGGEEGMMDGVSAGGGSSDGGNSSSGGAYTGYPYPVTDSDIHDPFFPSPAPSPSLVQQVAHQGNAGGFSIIPLTVHSSGGSVSRPTTLVSTSLSSSNPVLPPLGPRNSDSSTELPSPMCPVAGVEVHQHPLSTSSSSDSHGHSASCESSDSDSGGGAVAPSHRAASSAGDSNSKGSPAHPLLSTSTEPLFRPRTARSPSSASGPLEWASVSAPAPSSAVTSVVISPNRRRSLASSAPSRRSGKLRRGASSGSAGGGGESRRPATKSTTMGSLESL